MGTSEEISRGYPKDIDLREILMPPGPQFLRARAGEPQVHQRVPVRLMKPADKTVLVGQQATRLTRESQPNANGTKGTIIFTNASAALKGFPLSGAFPMACQAKAGFAQSMARELMPQGIHVANVPIDAAFGWTQEDGTRAHRLAGTSVDDNMADPDYIAETYLQLHRQHRSTWAFEVVLRPWVERW